MENLGEWERKNLIDELIQGMELAKQLRAHLNSPNSSSSQETREALVLRILASYEKALSMLGRRSRAVEPPSSTSLRYRSESSLSLGPEPGQCSGSPQSGGDSSDREFRELSDLQSWDASKKKKSVAKWTQRVRVSPAVDLEGTLDDGHTWRKYGQKDILGAKFPRGYYRCTHRNTQGCLATKQVQRSDDDPMVFEVTYRGRHTCSRSSCRALENQEPIFQQVGETLSEQNILQQQQQQQGIFSQDDLLNFGRGLRVITDELDSRNNPLFPSFDFPLLGNLAAPFTSSAGPDTLHDSGDQGAFRLSGSDHLSEIVLAATSRPNLTQLGSDSNQSGFDKKTPFDTPRFFN